MATDKEVTEMKNELSIVEVQRVKDEIQRIKDLHEIDNGGMCGPDPLTELETEAELRKLMDSLPKYKYLTESNIKSLSDKIKFEIKMLYYVTIEKLMDNKVKTEKDVLNLLEEINIAHTKGSKTLLKYGTTRPLDYLMALKCYKSLLFYLEDMKELSNEQKVKLASLIEDKLNNLEQVERDKMDEYVAGVKEKENEFEEAKKRFEALSFFKKMKLRITKQSPEYQEVKKMDVEAIKKLYK